MEQEIQTQRTEKRSKTGGLETFETVLINTIHCG